MTIASEITRIKTNIDNAYTALEAKGATIPSEKNSANLASTVNTISGGGVSDWLAYAAFNNNFKLINSPSYSGTEYTFPDGVTSTGIPELIQEHFQVLQNLEAECNQKKEEIANSSLPDAEKGYQIELTEAEYAAKADNAELSASVKMTSIIYLYSTIFNSNSIVTFNSNELNDFAPGMLPFEVKYVSLPSVKSISFGNNLSNDIPHMNIKEFSAPVLETISLGSLFLNGSLEKLYLNPQGTWGDCRNMCGSCPNLTDVTIPAIPENSTSSIDLFYAFAGCISLTNTCGIFNNVTNIPRIGSRGLDGTFRDCTSLTSTGLENVTSIDSYGLYNTFSGCTSLTSTGLGSLITIESNGLESTFQKCTSLTSGDLSSLTSIGNYGLSSTFSGCTSLTSVDLSNVTSIKHSGLQNAFHGCTNLTSLSFPKLNSNSFGNYTNQFKGMLQSVTGCTVHFPSNLESVIGSWSDVTAGFGGTNTTVLFDLPATT